MLIQKKLYIKLFILHDLSCNVLQILLTEKATKVSYKMYFLLTLYIVFKFSFFILNL